jgi:hypothetical protein
MDLKAQRQSTRCVDMDQRIPSLTRLAYPTPRQSHSRAFPEAVMAENSSKSDQIRKLRETRAVKGEKVSADRETDTKRDSKPIFLKSPSKAVS